MCRPHYNVVHWETYKESVCPEKLRDYHLQRKYGIGLADYASMLEAQNHRCGICNGHKDEVVVPKRFREGTPFVVDHCHVTGSVRKLLCHRCNIIVQSGVTEDILFRAIRYLKDHGDSS